MQLRTALATACATIALGLLMTAAAGAEDLTASHDEFEVIWDNVQPLRVSLTEELFVECEAFLLGTFHTRALPKTPGNLIANITNGAVTENQCVGGTIRFAAETFPWDLDYQSFSPALPNITDIDVSTRGYSMLIAIPGLAACRTASTGAELFANVDREAGGAVTSWEFDAATTVPIDDLSGSVLCDITGTVTVEGVSETVDNKHGGDLDIT